MEQLFELQDAAVDTAVTTIQVTVIVTRSRYKTTYTSISRYVAATEC
jgi:hypothetical protein